MASVWPTTRLKNLVEPVQNGVWGDEPQGGGDDVFCVRVADFDRRRFGLKPVDTVRAVSEKDRKRKMLRKGDILLEKSGGTAANPVGFTVMFDGGFPAVSSNFIGRVRMREGQLPRYWLYALAASYFTLRTQKCVRQTTGIQNLDQAAFLDEMFAVPPLGEQRAIAGYLDRETARIDTLIGEQQRLIEMLRERRLGVVRAGVTGLLSGGKRGTSDTWFGTLPDDWTSARIRYDFTVILGKMINASKVPHEGTVDAPYLAAGSIQPEALVLDDSKRMVFTRTEMTALDLQEGDVVVVEGGAGYGRSHYLRHDLVGWGFQNHVARLRPSTGRVDGLFATYCLKTCLASGYIEANNRTATLPSLSRDVLGSIQIPVPPMTEQRRIAKYLDEQTTKIDALIVETERFIELSRERRSALISAAVTGQIDLREVV